MKGVRVFKIFLVAMLLSAASALAAQDDHPLATYDGLSKALETKTPRLMIIDVRDFTDFKKAHIPGSLSMPYNTIPNKLYRDPPSTDKNMTLVIIDRFGNLAERAQTMFKSAGFKNVIIFGPIARWKGEKVPTK